MVADGLVEVIGTARSTRPSRHCGYIAQLRAKDRNALRVFVERLAATLQQDETTPSVTADGVAMTNTNNTPLGGNEHGASK
jgi:hypothetical protein